MSLILIAKDSITGQPTEASDDNPITIPLIGDGGVTKFDGTLEAISPMTIRGQAGQGANSIGGVINVIGGIGTGTATGGAVNILAGTTESGRGGQLALVGGDSGTNDHAGIVIIQGGQGNAAGFTSGGVLINSGVAHSDGSSGSVLISTKSGGGTSGNSGNVTIDIGAAPGGTRGTLIIGQTLPKITFTGGIGSSISVLGVGVNSEMFGAGATGIGAGATVVGNGATGNGGGGVAVGNNAASLSPGGIAIGTLATTGGQSSISIGGGGTLSGHDYSICIGDFAASSAANQLIIGSSFHKIFQMFIGAGVSAATTANMSINSTSGTGVFDGSDLEIAAGIALGSGADGELILSARGGSININEVGQESLSTTDFGATSIIGALNELASISMAGVGTLAATLAVGNTTNGTNIVLSALDNISSTNGTNQLSLTAGVVNVHRETVASNNVAMQIIKTANNTVSGVVNVIQIQAASSSGLPTAGFGSSIDFLLERGSGGGNNLAGRLSVITTTPLGGGSAASYVALSSIASGSEVEFLRAGYLGNVSISDVNLVWETDNTADIGATGATRPRTIYAGTSVVVPSVVATTSVTIGTTIITPTTLTSVSTFAILGGPGTGGASPGGDGKAVSITGGAGGQLGGAVSLTGGAGNQKSGGSAFVTAGASTNFIGGQARLKGGMGATFGGAATVEGGTGASNGGSVQMSGGSCLGTGPGGSAGMFGGSGRLTGAGGLVQIIAGNGGASGSDTGAGGAATFKAGNGATGSGAGGVMMIASGNGSVGGGAGGALSILGGVAGGSNQAGGAITVQAGHSTGTGLAGAISILGGNNQSGTVAGGTVTITGGNASSSSAAAGGAVAIAGGVSGDTDASVGGAVTIFSGSSAATNGDSGGVTIDAGAPTGSGTAGDVAIAATNAATLVLGTTGTLMSFFGVTAVSQQTDTVALTDSTTGSANNTVVDVGASFSQATLNDNFADITAKYNALRTVLRNLGLMA